MLVEIWSDVVCPWCYIGKRRFEAALATFDHRDEIEVRWRSFELDPKGPREREGSYIDRLARKYRVSREDADEMTARMTAAAAADGLDFHFDTARFGNTFDAHRLIHLAASTGQQDPMKERLLAATFTESKPIGDTDTLVQLAIEVGLDEAKVREALEGDAFADEVRADENEALELGVTGVPFFLFDRRFGLSGAQQPQHLAKALATAWRESHPVEMLGGDADGSCEGDNCAI